MASDESWSEVAYASRAALALLGYPITPTCFPDEAEPCGATFAMHAMEHFAVLMDAKIDDVRREMEALITAHPGPRPPKEVTPD